MPLLAAVLIAVFVALWMISPVTRADAAPGDLDATFGSGGTRVTDVGGGSARAIAIQPDGKIVLVGHGYYPLPPGEPAPNEDAFVIVRYNANGSLDTTFSGDGLQFTEFGASPFRDSEAAAAVALQPDGKIVVAGTALVQAGQGATFRKDEDFVLARYNPDGSLDTSFSGDGKQETNFGRHEMALTMAIAPAGQIVVGGYTSSQATDATCLGHCSGSDFALARYEADGSLDTSFSGDGRETTSLGNWDSVRGLALQPDGKILAAGKGNDGSFGLARYNPDGSLDSSFSGDGVQLTDLYGGGSTGLAVALQPDGKIVVAGTAVVPAITYLANRLAIARFLSDGALDPSFSRDGKQSADFDRYDHSWDSADAVALQEDGRIVTAGTTKDPAGRSNFAIAQFNPNGTLNFGFGGGGRQTTELSGHDSANAIALQPDGRIVVAGASHNPNVFDSCRDPLVAVCRDFAVARYQGAGGPFDTTPPDTIVTSAPPALTMDTTPSFEFTSTEPGSTFECKLNAEDFEPCSTGATRRHELCAGDYTFAVRATDRSDNTDPTPATATFTVSNQAARPCSGAAGPSPAGSGSGTAPARSGNFTGTPAASNSAPTTPSIDTVITRGPTKRTPSRRAAFRFRSNTAAARFQCKLDRRRWESCRSPKRYRGMKRGRHTFRVRAIDPKGRVDRTPAIRRWRVR